MARARVAPCHYCRSRHAAEAGAVGGAQGQLMHTRPPPGNNGTLITAARDDVTVTPLTSLSSQLVACHRGGSPLINDLRTSFAAHPPPPSRPRTMAAGPKPCWALVRTSPSCDQGSETNWEQDGRRTLE